MRVTDEMVNRFLSWRLPNSVCVDPIVYKMPDASGREPRYGTNLLSASEARDMLHHVMDSWPQPMTSLFCEKYPETAAWIINELSKRLESVEKSEKETP